MTADPSQPVIRPAAGPADIVAARALFVEYATWLADDHAISLEFQGIDEELASLPGKYAAPNGSLLLAELEGQAVGSIALRPYDGKTCEIKRLYVRPTARGYALGQRLIAAILQAARDIGYRRAILDTAGFMSPAQRLYESFGFSDIPAYNDNPVPGVRHLGCDL
ncbi:MAG: GNAT family N-acetyltransferase [Pseudomonadota bacterium]